MRGSASMSKPVQKPRLLSIMAANNSAWCSPKHWKRCEGNETGHGSHTTSWSLLRISGNFTIVGGGSVQRGARKRSKSRWQFPAWEPWDPMAAMRWTGGRHSLSNSAPSASHCTTGALMRPQPQASDKRSKSTDWRSGPLSASPRCRLPPSGPARDRLRHPCLKKSKQ